jgi:CSLREA domain-containing protein
VNRARFALALVLLLTAPLLLVAAPVPTTGAAGTITVITTNDELGPGSGCSLREAIQAANADSAFGGCPAGNGMDTIILAAGVTYTLSTQDNGQFGFNGTPAVYTSIIIEGNGATITRGGSLPLRLLHVAANGDSIGSLDALAPSGGDLTEGVAGPRDHSSDLGR